MAADALDDLDRRVATDAGLLADSNNAGPLQDDVRRALNYKAGRKSTKRGRPSEEGVALTGAEAGEDEEEEEEKAPLPKMERYRPADLIRYTPEVEADIQRRTNIIINHGRMPHASQSASFFGVAMIRLLCAQTARMQAEQNKQDVWAVLEHKYPELFVGRAGYVPRSQRKRRKTAAAAAGVT